MGCVSVDMGTFRTEGMRVKNFVLQKEMTKLSNWCWHARMQVQMLTLIL